MADNLRSTATRQTGVYVGHGGDGSYPHSSVTPLLLCNQGYHSQSHWYHSNWLKNNKAMDYVTKYTILKVIGTILIG